MKAMNWKTTIACVAMAATMVLPATLAQAKDRDERGNRDRFERRDRRRDERGGQWLDRRDQRVHRGDSHSGAISIRIGAPVVRRESVSGHYETRTAQVLVEPAHYETQFQRVLVEEGHWATQHIPAVHEVRQGRRGRTTVIVTPARTERVWIEPRYETRTVQIWVPARYETRTTRVWVPDGCVTRPAPLSGLSIGGIFRW